MPDLIAEAYRKIHNSLKAGSHHNATAATKRNIYNIDEDGNNILIACAKKSNYSAASHILDTIDTINSEAAKHRYQIDKNRYVNHQNNKGCSALHYAAQKGNITLTTLLCDLGSDIDVTDNKQNTPLHRATQKGHHHQVIEFLLDQGAATDCCNKDGNTPLHLLLMQEINSHNEDEHCAIIALLANTRSLAIKNHKNKTVLDILHDNKQIKFRTKDMLLSQLEKYQEATAYGETKSEDDLSLDAQDTKMFLEDDFELYQQEVQRKIEKSQRQLHEEIVQEKPPTSLIGGCLCSIANLFKNDKKVHHDSR